MLFTSVPFLLYFMPTVFLGYQLLGKLGRRPVIIWLALASLFFYAYWNPKFLFVLVGSILVNFFFSRRIASAREAGKKGWMVAGIIANLGVLCYFKYLFPLLGWLSSFGSGHHRWENIVLPLGISFFTFTQIAYLVDLSQEEATAQSLPEYALFVTFFPHLIAGPILHHREIMPQFSQSRRYQLQAHDFLVGLSWFILGLLKKAAFADKLAPIADFAFRHVGSLSPLDTWIGLLSYSLQLYFDFSGYSDMAIGLARMFSLEFPLNFNSPYKATNIIDFWSRWHMTLTRYLTLYLYNPISLAINRRRIAAGKKVSRAAQRTTVGFLAMVAFPLCATMFLAGVWHGAGLQFLIFGMLHGFYLVINHAWRIFRKPSPVPRSPSRVEHVACLLLTYICVLVGQLFFRADSAGQAVAMLASLLGYHAHAMGPLPTTPLLLLLVLFAVVWFAPNTQEILAKATGSAEPLPRQPQAGYLESWPWALGMGLLFLCALLFVSQSSTFLYFQF